MPEISRFSGIIIRMYYKPKEHDPSHIHATYGENVGVFELETLRMTEGDLPKKIQDLVTEWLGKYQSELMVMWETQNIRRLPPL